MLISFQSELLKRPAPFHIFLPVEYETTVLRYPVLYLLHGLNGHCHDWPEKSQVVAALRQYPLILVAPEGGNGWYTNGLSPDDRWEDYLIRELIPVVDTHYRTLRDQRGRAIAGNAMGGYGAMKLGLLHPGEFSFAGSLSGALDAPVWGPERRGDRREVRGRSLESAFGLYGGERAHQEELERLLQTPPPLPFLYVDCGTEDELIEENRRFSRMLMERKIPHEYRQRPGGHDWKTWDRQVRDLLRVLGHHWQLGWGHYGGAGD